MVAQALPGRAGARPWHAVTLPRGKSCSLRLRGPGGRQSQRIAADRVYQGSQDAESRAIALQPDAEQADPVPYLEPFVRSFLLGVTFGGLFELCHVAAQFAGVVQEVGFAQVSAVVASRSRELFSPNLFFDHAGALGSWCLCYMLEASAVSAALKELNAVSLQQVQDLGKLTEVPKLMLPLRLDSLKHYLLRASERVARAELPQQAPLTAVDLEGAGPLAFVDEASPGQTGTLPQGRTVLPPLELPLPEAPERDQEQPQPPQQEPPAAKLPPLEERRRQKGLAPGAWDPSTSSIARRAKELQGRAAFLTGFWYAAAISEKVGSKPVGVQLAGQHLVLYRDSAGAIHCLSDVCPHRGAPMHQGWVAHKEGGDCLVCPYHGWAFDGQGVLQDVPAAEEHADWPRKQMLEVYPVQEKGGFVWLFYGSKHLPADERPPIPFCPELEDPSWRPVYGEITFDCPYHQVFENAIDMAHIHYLHSGTFGNQEQPEIRDMTVSTNAYGVDASFRLHNKPVNAMWNFSQVAEVHVTAQALLPATSIISFTLGRGLSFTTFVNTVPLDGNRTINRFALVRKLDVDPIGASVFNAPVWDSLARQAMLKILGEDKTMVEQLRPQDLSREISVKADLVQLSFRKVREDYLAMGYGQQPQDAQQRIDF